jgi:SAM-dependent methyltransferase
VAGAALAYWSVNDATIGKRPKVPDGTIVATPRRTFQGRCALLTKRPHLRPLALLVTTLGLATAFALGGAIAQTAKTYEPKEYQDGKDVVWVPTAQPLVDKMLDMANVTASDYVVDLGSGDGRTVITAAQRGAKALGIEYNPRMVELSRQNALKAGVADKATFVKADLFRTDFSQATVVTLFLLPEINIKLRPKILAMKPGTRVVSNSFDMGNWKADQTIDTVGHCETYCNAFFWVVPAKVDGTWQVPQGELTLKQSFQFVTGSLTAGKVATPVKGRLNGVDITLTAGSTQFSGKVNGNAIEGTAKTGDKEEPWKATRAK